MKPATGTCKGCKAPFKNVAGKGRPREFCSFNCGQAFRARQRYVPVPPRWRSRVPEICAYCTGPCETAHLYCSRVCQSADTRLAKERICTSCTAPWIPNWRPLSQAATECWDCRSDHFVEGGRSRTCIKEYRRGQLLAREDNRCEDCHKHFKPDELECHHILPEALGGSHLLENLKLLCHDCHQGSGWARNHAALLAAELVIPPTGTQLVLAA